MRRKSQKKSGGLIPVLVLAVIALAFLVVYLIGKPYPKVKLHAGYPMIEASTFFKNGGKASFVKNDVDVKQPGEYQVKLKKGLFTYTSTVIVEDTVAPVVDYYQSMNVSCGDSLLPEALIKTVTEDSYYTVSWVHSPDTGIMGNTTAEVSVKDGAGNETTFTCNIHVIDPNIMPVLTVEVGEPPKETDFFKDGNAKNEPFSLFPELKSIDFDTLGDNSVTMTIHDDTYELIIRVKDTVAPVATVVDKKVKKDGTPQAKSFVKDIIDKTQVEVSFAETPDFSAYGDTVVKLLLTDEAGNTTLYEAKATVADDTTAPVISGQLDRNIYIGEEVSLLTGVSAVDEFDGDVVLYVTKDQLKADEIGDYQVTYWAVDESGNKAEITGNVHVFANRSDEEKFTKLYDKLASQIFTEGMTLEEKAKAIYDWGITKIKYVGSPNVPTHDNWRLEAIYAVEKKSGDCYTYYAFSRALFEYVGIPYYEVNRIYPNKRGSHHYWFIINVGKGWYQFDNSPRAKSQPFNGFLFTLAEGEKYSKTVTDYFLFDQSLYTNIEIK